MDKQQYVGGALEAGSLQREAVLRETWFEGKKQDEANAKRYLQRIGQVDLIPMLMEPITNVRYDDTGRRLDDSKRKRKSKTSS